MNIFFTYLSCSYQLTQLCIHADTKQMHFSQFMYGFSPVQQGINWCAICRNATQATQTRLRFTVCMKAIKVLINPLQHTANR